tara:strand:+ start:3832 stop:4155 length:324 start_codon:yes stop_codon:yes gene_type:complete
MRNRNKSQAAARNAWHAIELKLGQKNAPLLTVCSGINPVEELTLDISLIEHGLKLVDRSQIHHDEDKKKLQQAENTLKWLQVKLQAKLMLEIINKQQNLVMEQIITA